MFDTEPAERSSTQTLRRQVFLQLGDADRVQDLPAVALGELAYARHAIRDLIDR